ncbi:MAG: thiamine pyrophosphate-binding protein [Candidatus Omnitrophota bacterium]
MKLSDFVVEFLKQRRVTSVFELCGGSIIHILDSLHKQKKIRIISMHHEQAAAIAAEGFARCKGSVGVAMATSGPGATNMITGIASCFFDSIPCVFITGQVNTYEFKFGKPVRQIGFQETDIVSVVKPIVKYAQLVTEPQKIRYYLEKAFYLAQVGRPGPVLLDIPMNVQRADIIPGRLMSFSKPAVEKNHYSIAAKIQESLKALSLSSRPVVLAGGGVRLSGAQEELRRFIEKTGIPVVNSLMGVDAFPGESRFSYGMLGTYGNRYANLTIANSDLILALGTRFDTRQTGTNPKTFARGAKIIHVDIDKNELNNKIKADLAVKSDIKVFLVALNKSLKKFDKARLTQWQARISGYKRNYPSFLPPKAAQINPNFFINKLSGYLADNAIICADIGQNQIWAAQSILLKRNMRFLTQGGMGAMGSALALAVGASLAYPKRPIIAVCGDGGFQLNSQELQTVYHYGLPIKIIIINNSCYGMVRQFQKQYFNSVFQSTVIGYSHPDFCKLSQAYKIKARRVVTNAGIPKACKWLFEDAKPSLLEVKIPRHTQVLPKLSVGRPIEDQDPLLPRDEFKALMINE